MRAVLVCNAIPPCGRVEVLDHASGDQFFCCGAKMAKLPVPNPTRVIDQTRNGVRVVVTDHYDTDGERTGRTVEADCECFGSTCRTHSNPRCPNIPTRRCA